jgi:Methyltransferase domain
MNSWSRTHNFRTRLELLDSLPKQSIGAELGVFEGAFSREILKIVQPEVLFLVDRFDGRIASGDHNGENIHWRDGEELYQLLRIEHADKAHVHVVMADSFGWLSRLRPGLLDWVYIDTTHTYEQTADELRAAARVVKPGGCLCGHDYAPQSDGVIRAVEEFCGTNYLNREIFGGDKLPSFLIRVPSILIKDADGYDAMDCMSEY